jgi:hypothetical protein
MTVQTANISLLYRFGIRSLHKRRAIEIRRWASFFLLYSSVADPDPQDPYVFGPPGSGSFYSQAKIVRKTLIPTVL